MINLAPYKYRNVLKVDGGPIAEITYCEKEILFGVPGYSFHATIDANLTPNWKRIWQIYGSSHGNGSGPNKNIAYYKAISEALERWAFIATHQSPRKDKFGFDIDDSTSGMAAFPGLTKGMARNKAILESIERWSMVEWWDKQLSHRPVTYKPEHGITAIEIANPFSIPVVLLCKCNDIQSIAAFGFAAGNTLHSACQKAEIELHRNFSILSQCNINQIDRSTLNLIEKRLLFFAKEGSDLVRERISMPLATQITTAPTSLVDSEINGPWSSYATVWRVLFEHKNVHHLCGREDYFAF